MRPSTIYRGNVLSHSASAVSGHVRKEPRVRGDVWVGRLRTIDQRKDGTFGPTQRTVTLGLAYGGKGRPPAGQYTQRTAEEELVRLLDAERVRVGGGKATAVTFGQAADEWLRHSQDENGCAFATMADYRRIVGVLKLAFGADTPLTKITTQAVEQHKTTIKGTGVSARTTNRHLVILGGIFRRADAKWGTGHNPASGKAVKRLRESWNGRPIRFYRPAEVHALVASTRDPTLEAMFMFAALTGLRLGELRALRWHDVDLMAQRVHVRRALCGRTRTEKAPKSGKSRSVPLAMEVQQVLARLRDVTGFGADDDLVFPAWDGGHCSYEELTKVFKQAQSDAGLPPIRFHDLRHTFGTICASSGMAMTTIQQFMGHAHIGTTQIYAHFAPAGDEAARISAAFASARVPAVTSKQAA